MRFDLTSDQELLRDTTIRYSEENCSLTAIRSLMEDEARVGLPEDYLRQGGELGWFSLLVPEALGGGSISEHGLVDAAIVAEVRGARMQPGPFVAMNVVAHALAAAGSEAMRTSVLPSVMAGERIATWAPGAVVGAGTPVIVRRTGDGYELRGSIAPVPYGQFATWVLVEVDLDGRRTAALIGNEDPNVLIEPLRSFDLAARMATVHLDGVIVGEDQLLVTDDPSAPEQRVDVAAVLSAAETVGAMDRLFEITVEYAKDRVAFGRPIGSFQALKHQMADAGLLLEMSKAVSDSATDAVAAGSPSASVLASAAKAYGGDASTNISQCCFQVHGGIGFTWEHDLHMYLRRASANAALYGTAHWHRLRSFELAAHLTGARSA